VEGPYWYEKTVLVQDAKVEEEEVDLWEETAISSSPLEEI
jgi:hypothetical protein